ncbi:MAG: hypothetical protein ABFD70_05820 [Syntrophaceae bacterium]|nr:hypothetical protein [Deltaproteobacteria bacterium]
MQVILLIDLDKGSPDGNILVVLDMHLHDLSLHLGGDGYDYAGYIGVIGALEAEPEKSRKRFSGALFLFMVGLNS